MPSVDRIAVWVQVRLIDLSIAIKGVLCLMPLDLSLTENNGNGGAYLCSS